MVQSAFSIELFPLISKKCHLKMEDGTNSD